MLSSTPGALWRIGKYYWIVLGHKKKEQSLEGGDRHTHRHGWPWHQCPGPSHLPSDRLLAGGTVALGYCGNSQVLQVLLQAPQHGVQGGPVILLVGYGFLAGICFRCNLYQEENHKESYPLASSARPRSLPWTSSKALEESNIATPKKKKMLSSPFHSKFLRLNELWLAFLFADFFWQLETERRKMTPYLVWWLQVNNSSFYSFMLPCLLGSWFVPLTALGSWCRAILKTNLVSALMEFIFSE